MESQNCVFCVKSPKDGNTVKRGCDTINQASEKICDSIEVKGD